MPERPKSMIWLTLTAAVLVQIYDLASNTHARASQIYDLVELTAAVLVQIRGFKETIGKADY